MVSFGIDRLLAEPELRRPLAGRRVALLAHPASVTTGLTHSLDALCAYIEANRALWSILLNGGAGAAMREEWLRQARIGAIKAASD